MDRIAHLSLLDFDTISRPWVSILTLLRVVIQDLICWLVF